MYESLLLKYLLMSSLKPGESCSAVSKSVVESREPKNVSTKISLEEEDFHQVDMTIASYIL